MAAVLSAALTSGAFGSASVYTLAPFASISAKIFSLDAAVIELKLEISVLRSDYDTFIVPAESELKILSTAPIITSYKAEV